MVVKLLLNKAIKFTHTYPQNPPFFGGFCFVSINATILETHAYPMFTLTIGMVVVIGGVMSLTTKLLSEWL